MSASLPRVALTGAGSPLAQTLRRRWRRGGVEIVGSDRIRPSDWRADGPFEPVDLSAAHSAERLAAFWQRERVEAVVHTALPGPSSAEPGDCDSHGTDRVLRAGAAAGVEALVLASSTMLYGARADNPLYLRENDPLRCHPAVPWLEGRIDAERAVARWRRRHRRVHVTVLRSGWRVGARARGRFVDHVSRRWVPVPLGYDPLLQLVHEDDCARCYETALVDPKPGVYNVVARGVATLRTLLRRAGLTQWPVPGLLWPSLTGGDGRRDAGFYDFLRFPWVADGARGWAAFGEPRYTTREAWASLFGARRLREFG